MRENEQPTSIGGGLDSISLALFLSAWVITCGFGPNCRVGSGYKPDCPEAKDRSVGKKGP